MRLPSLLEVVAAPIARGPRDPTTSGYHLSFMVGLVRGSSNMVLELGGLEFKPRPRIFHFT
jgi:hypothetical protein